MIKELSQTMNGSDPAYYRIPETRREIAQYMLLYSMSGKDPMEGLVSPLSDKTRVSSRIEDVYSPRAYEIYGTIQKWIEKNSPDDLKVTLTGMNPVAHMINTLVVDEIFYTFLLAFAVITILLVIQFRSLGVGLISLLPNILPLTIILGMIGALGINLKPSSAITFSIAFGIAVDDTVHFITRYLSEHLQGRPEEEVLHRAIHGTGKSDDLHLHRAYQWFFGADFHLQRARQRLVRPALRRSDFHGADRRPLPAAGHPSADPTFPKRQGKRRVNPFPLYIMAGGTSRRFGSDKARARLANGTMIEAAARQFSPFVSRITVVADRVGKYDDLGLETIGDLKTGNGPLGGVQAALAHFEKHRQPSENWILVSACDLLGLQSEWIETLETARTSESLSVAFKGKRWEPFPTLLHLSSQATVEDLLKRNVRSYWRLFDALPNVAVDRPKDWELAYNLNTLEELRKCELSPSSIRDEG